jgi:hypothetical protein
MCEREWYFGVSVANHRCGERCQSSVHVSVVSSGGGGGNSSGGSRNVGSGDGDVGRVIVSSCSHRVVNSGGSSGGKSGVVGSGAGGGGGGGASSGDGADVGIRFSCCRNVIVPCLAGNGNDVCVINSGDVIVPHCLVGDDDVVVQCVTDTGGIVCIVDTGDDVCVINSGDVIVPHCLVGNSKVVVVDSSGNGDGGIVVGKNTRSVYISDVEVI